MNNKIAKEYRALSPESQLDELEKLYKEYYVLRQKSAVGGLQQTHLLRQKRRSIACLHTLIHSQ